MQKTVKVVHAYHGMGAYARAAKADPGADRQALWQEHVIEPYWAAWAGGQFNEERTRAEHSRPYEDLDRLAVEVERLETIDLDRLVETAFQAVCELLEPYVDEVVVCIYALDPANDFVRTRMNGVLGTCIGDNILLQVDPGISGWQKWAPYVLAHELHHTIWGFHYFAVLGNTSMDLLTGMVVDGQADSFAQWLYPGLEPGWVNALTPEQERQQWDWIQGSLNSNDIEVYKRVMFGDEQAGVPASTGYTFGYKVVQAYLSSNPDITFRMLLDVSAEEILAEGGYQPPRG